MKLHIGFLVAFVCCLPHMTYAQELPGRPQMESMINLGSSVQTEAESSNLATEATDAEPRTLDEFLAAADYLLNGTATDGLCASAEATGNEIAQAAENPLRNPETYGRILRGNVLLRRLVRQGVKPAVLAPILVEIEQLSEDVSDASIYRSIATMGNLTHLLERLSDSDFQNVQSREVLRARARSLRILRGTLETLNQ